MQLKEIAQALGVSAASISIVRCGKQGVSDSTRRYIQQALDENGYSYKTYHEFVLPSTQKEQKSISLLKFKNSALLTDKNDGFVEAIIDTLDTFIKENNCKMQLNVTPKERYLQTLQEINQSACIGCIVIATEMERKDIELLKILNMPIVILDSDHPNLPFSSVTMCNRDIAFQAVQHLIKNGKKTIGYLKSNIRTGNFIGRENGYYEALRAFKLLSFEPILLTPSFDSAYLNMLLYLENEPKIPQNLFAENDILAIGAMRALLQKGYRVPEDVQIIGVDNTALAQVSTPSLTSLHISKINLCNHALQLLFAQIKEKTDPVHIRIGTHLIQRNSTMP